MKEESTVRAYFTNLIRQKKETNAWFRMNLIDKAAVIFMGTFSSCTVILFLKKVDKKAESLKIQ